MKHFLNPKNMGEIGDADGVGDIGNMKCGDRMVVYLKVKDGFLEDVKFKTFGCVAAIAASDILCELAKGLSIEEAKKIDNNKIIEKLGGLPNLKLHCSVLGAEALKKAIQDYEENGKNNNFNNEI